MDGLLSDLRFVIRQMTRRPGFSLLAIATLAIGTGASAAMFGIVDQVLLRPLPFPDSDRLVQLCETNQSMGSFCVASPPNVQDWAREGRAFASVGQGRGWPFKLEVAGEKEGVNGGLAEPGLFRTLGVTPLLGRLIQPFDLAPGSGHVAVISHGLWTSRFGSDSTALGRFLSLDGEQYEVVGVLRPGLEVPHLEHVELWVPFPFDPRDEQNRRWRGFMTVARLHDGVDPAAAERELVAIQEGLAGRYPATNRGWSARIVPLLDSLVGPVRTVLLAFVGAVALLLLAACANVASLLVARGAARERELAVRAAVGARPGALFRLLAAESLALAILGAAAGVLVAAWTADALLALMPGGLPRIEHVAFDTRTLVAAVLLTAVAGLLAGVAPALRAARLNLVDSMRTGHQADAWRRVLGLRGGLVAGQVMAAVVLAVGAGLLARSYLAQLRWNPGFDRSHLLVFWSFASTDRYPDRDRVSDLFVRLEQSLLGLPGVTGAGMASSVPLSGGEETGEFVRVSGDPTEQPMSARWYDMSPSYFPALGVPLKSGRLLSEADRAGAPTVALINEAMARRYFAGMDPIGQQIINRGRAEPIEIVGVVGDVVPFKPGEEASPEVYWPYRQRPRWASSFVVRTTGDPRLLAGAVAERMAAIDPDLRPSQVQTMEDLVTREVARPRFQMLLIGVFAALALVLSLVGVYGVVGASVAARTREFGVRLALGATSRSVLVMVLREGGVLTGIGLAAGMLAAVGLSRLAAALTPGVRSTDPLTYGAIMVLVGVASLLACVVPAVRATRVHPMETLRAE